MPTGLTISSVSGLHMARFAGNHSSNLETIVEAFDEPWKEVNLRKMAQLIDMLSMFTFVFALQIYGGVEPHWGVFDEHRNLKAVTLPDCSHT